jgi:uncharacterized protein (TIGR04255 family)
MVVSRYIRSQAGRRDAWAMTDTIVSFAAPPVVEVVAAVAFDGVDAELGPLLAAFWKEQLRESFPRLQQQPPYSAPVEQFPLSGPTPSLNFALGGAFPSARLWAVSADGEELLQLQPGYFACNWRKVQPDREYDRWLRRRTAFEHWYGALCEFLAVEGSGQPKITQCEVTYINHIQPGQTWRDHADFGRIFTVAIPAGVGYPFEQASLQIERQMRHDDEPYGRLHVKILPAFARDGKSPLYVLELTARGAPMGDGVAGALAFLDRGREAIDRNFVAITSEEMHQEWGLVK